jgi:hypothetical protein
MLTSLAEGGGTPTSRNAVVETWFFPSVLRE